MAGAEKKTDSHPEVMTMRTTKTTSRSSIQHSRSTKTIPAAKTVPGAGAIKGISDKALLSGIRRLSQKERKTVLSILVHLVEIDSRRLYLSMGYSSLFEFCVKHLGYSESRAVRRVQVARCIGQFPQCYDALSSGKVNMTNLASITRIITAENVSDLLSRIAGASRKEVDLLVSSRRPKSAIRDKVTPVYIKTLLEVRSDPAGRAAGKGAGSENAEEQSADLRGGKKTTATGGGKNPSTSEGIKSSGSGEGPAASPETGGRPFAEQAFVLEERFKVTFGVDQGFLDKLERVRSLLSSKHHRKLEFEELFEILIDEYIERHSPEGRLRRKEKREQRKAGKKTAETQVGKTSRPPGTDRSAAGGSKKPGKNTRFEKNNGLEKKEVSRYIPQRVKDEVYLRDKGRCTYRSPDGRRCGSKRDLQVDHIVPFARGGDDSPSNLRLLCGKHNRLEAERVYGKMHMEQYLKESPGRYGYDSTAMKEARDISRSMRSSAG